MGKTADRLQKSCNCFGYDIDEGMKAYSIVECFLGVFNMIISLFLGFYCVKPMIDEYNLEDQPKAMKGFALFMEMTLQILCASVLFLTGILGVLVYPIGWRTRNITVCWMWIFVAPINVVILFCLLIIQVIPVGKVYDQLACPSGALAIQCQILIRRAWGIRIPFYWLLYLLYIPYGMAIQLGFVTWAKEAGVAVMISVAQVRSEVGHEGRQRDFNKDAEDNQDEGLGSQAQSSQEV